MNKRRNLLQKNYLHTLETALIDINPNKHWSYCSYFDSKKIKNHGFKIHLSGSINNANAVLSLSLPYLIENKLNFKVVSSLQKLELQNRGIYGQSQIGKLVTIYPENDTVVSKILFDLHLITKCYDSPTIPSDFQYRNSGVVYYRYGLLIDNKSNNIKLSDGSIFKDTREKVIPHEFQNLISDYKIPRYNAIPKEYIIIEILKVRGKGSIYKILDLNDKKIKVMKEGKALGEIEVSGIDGADRLIWEAYVLNRLDHIQQLPSIHHCFYIHKNFYIVEDFIEGKTLGEYCLQSNFDYYNIDLLMIKILKSVELVHKSGFIINDLSMSNILVDDFQNIYLIDLEFASTQNKECPPFINIGTPGFFNEQRIAAQKKDDIYSLICIYYYLLLPNEYSKLIQSNPNSTSDLFYLDKNFGKLNNKDKQIIHKGLNGEIKDMDTLLAYFKGDRYI